jgi:hypothetical protein
VRAHHTIPAKFHERHRRGTVLIWVSVAMIVFVGFVSLAVDLGRLRLVKNQLQFTADAAARYAAQGLADGTTAAKAISVAASNLVDGTAQVIQNTDVVTGTWSNGAFTPGGSSPNAVKVTAYRTAARGTAVKVWWGGLMGKSSADVSAFAIATATFAQPAGFIGYGSVTLKNNTFFGSYNSATNTHPTESNAASNAYVGSNGTIAGGNNNTLQGNAILGPAGAVSNLSVTGSTQTRTTPLTPPTMPAWSPVNPTSYVVLTNTVLPGGTYWYNSLTINAHLTFSGPATVYVNGDVIVAANLAPASGVPADLTIYQFGAHTFGDTAINGMNVTARVIAPGSDFVANNNLTFAGSGLFNTITAKNNADFFYDSQLGPSGNGSVVVSTVQ